jgi:glucosyl-3-phosphoglycerate synthase
MNTDSTIVLLVPAKNESTVIAPTLQVMSEAIRRGVVSRAVVLDSGSIDDTALIVREAGIECIDTATVCGGNEPVLGKGDSVWRAISSIRADMYVLMDADLGNVSTDHIDALAQPLLHDGDVMFVKSGFVRVDEHGVPREKAAGRVTEEVGRPLAARESIRLAEFSQPLSGQIAVRRSALRGLSIATGYGLEIAMLIDMWRQFGDRGMMEVDWGHIFNRWKPDEALTEVATQVLAGASLRGVTLPRHGVVADSQVVDRLVN